ncbi:MAG: acyltransferase [Bdellovibrionales bacterium]|nr:acyltransferase [Bdellovibrionales bacterium]
MQTQRSAELDGLRGLAILLVMGFHFYFFPRQFGVPLAEFASPWLDSGWIGVDLFFVLSGFLITGLLADSRGSQTYFRRFYLRRTLRIFPLYYFLLLIYFVGRNALPLGLNSEGHALATSSLWSYTSNFLLAAKGWDSLPVLVGHLWTLAIEEQFYLLWPFVIAFVPTRLVLWICAVLILLCPVARAWQGDLAAYVLTPFRMDTLAAGAGLALLLRGPYASRVRRLSLPLLAFSGAMLVALFVLRAPFRGEDPLILSLGLSLFALFFTALISSLLSGPSWLSAVFRWRELRTLGRISYALYLVHQPVCLLLLFGGFTPAVLQYFDPSSAVALFAFFALPFAASVVLALVCWFVIERPVLRLKDRWSQPQGEAFERVSKINNEPKRAVGL